MSSQMGKTGYFIYNDTEERVPFTGRGYVPPHFTYLKHFRNYVALTFILRACIKEGRIIDIQQAKKELAICEAKLGRAEARRDFDWSAIRKDCEAEIKKWGMTTKDIDSRWLR